jgi:hypothetical protein
VEGDGRWKRQEQRFDEMETATVIPEVEAVAEISVMEMIVEPKKSGFKMSIHTSSSFLILNLKLLPSQFHLNTTSTQLHHLFNHSLFETPSTKKSVT